MFQVSAKIIYNNKIKKNYFEIALAARQIAKSALPGQFVNIKVSDGIEPLLRRPLSIHRVSHKFQVSGHRSEEKEYIVMLYEVVGKGTEILSQKKEGEYLDVIGPLGNGFDYRLPITDYRLPILVAGGMGTAPLVFLSERLRRTMGEGRGTIVLLGAKTKGDILCEKEFRELGFEVKIATDDGSRGFKGYVTDLLENILRPSSFVPRLSLYACGPQPMLKEISLISQKYNIPAQLSLESHMACGIGACMGCVIKVKSEKRKTQNASHVSLAGDFEYKRVCYDGPVFEAEEIAW